MRVLVTGADGFIGRNLTVRLTEQTSHEVTRFTRKNKPDDLPSLVANADFVFHLAGVNRPIADAEFTSGNIDLTERLCAAISVTGRHVPVVYTSSTQAERDSPYGRSKSQAERSLLELNESTGNPVQVFRLPNVFGKWSRPHYNSVVATFCHNIARQLPIRITDPAAVINLIYVDDVVSAFLSTLAATWDSRTHYRAVSPQYRITVGELAEQIRAFRDSRTSLLSERVGTGLTRALYSTYVSFLPVNEFSYEIPKYGDARGVFVEMLKTQDSGQFSYFTAHPGVTRGGHYHHSKTEKFLVIKGEAHFRFKHLITSEYFELFTTGEKPEVVETVPGWTHDITNVGDEEMIVMLWANEIFDRARPDTIARPLA